MGSTQSLDSINSLADQLSLIASNNASLKSDYERIAQEMYTQNLALAQNNRTLSILRAIDLIILESGRDLAQLSTDISQAIIESSPYPVISILSRHNHNDPFINFQGWALNTYLTQKVFKTGILDKLKPFKIPLDGKWISGPERFILIDLTDLSAISEVTPQNKETDKILQTLYKEFGIQTLYFTKLRARGSLSGAMMIGLEDPMPKIDDIELIERIGEPAGIALDNRLLFEENQHVLKQLQESNLKLKEIDEAKDEFISMASHQLRTPLTSMKGYVSMVLEGDTGPISDTQRNMLQQAFDSSQRMVYLIADLLNVSRLRTGKFIIENKPTYLPDVVEGELSQLRETATAREISLYYKKPEQYPTVMLDETKIRQVIMNFLDNAIYYTPRGGRITAELHASPKSIQFTVTDTGLGVPKNEQQHLFTKFYRANNARKLRPDGTGLGLYMAQKVIVAQGGAILFKSEESEGSTFGFSFPREKIEIKK